MRYASLCGAFIFWLGVVLNATAATHYVDLNCTNPVPPYADWSTAATNIQDAIISSSSGDIVLVTNGVYQNGDQRFLDPVTEENGHSRIIISNGVAVCSVNGPGVTAIQGGEPFYCCAFLETNAVLNGFMLTNGTASPSGYGSFGGGAYCLTTNCLISNCIICSNSAYAGAGVYLGTLTNCVLSNNVATGFGSPEIGYLSGGGACGSVLNGCILIGNTAYQGGGAFNCILNHSTLIGNTAAGGEFTAGGGAFRGALNSCLVISNSTLDEDDYYIGGAVCSNALNNCLITYNIVGPDEVSAAVGCTMTNCTIAQNKDVPGSDGSPVVQSCVLRNCILYYNGFLDGAYPSDLKNCCAEPGYELSLFNGNTNNNFSNPPLFVNTNGDFHLLSNSPCLNSGNNAYVAGTTDLDGNPRIAGGMVDMGAYEYPSPSSTISYFWLQQYGLPTDGSVDNADLDGAGFSVYQDWIAGLNPTNSASVLVMSSVSATNNAPGVTVSWQSVNNRTYDLQRATDLTAPPAFFPIQSNIVGQAGTTTYTDTTATNGGPYFYRVGVQQF